IVVGARVSQPPRTQATILPVSGSDSLQILRLKGPAATCHWVWNQQMRSGMEIVDCEKLRAFSRPDSLNGRPAQSSGLGPAPRSMASSVFLAVQEPDRSISAKAGRATQSNAARLAVVLKRVMMDILSLFGLLTMWPSSRRASIRLRSPAS